MTTMRNMEVKVTIPLSTLESLKRDAARLDKLDRMRRHYSRPPFRAVTGWEWSVVSERDQEELFVSNVRYAIDQAKDPTP